MDEKKATAEGPLDEVRIPEKAISQFVAAFLEFQPDNSLCDPLKTLKKLLYRSQLVVKGYYIFERWVFEIREGALENIFVVPSLSRHAKQRLIERFGERQNNLTKVVRALAYGRILSQKEKKRMRLKGNITALKHEDKVYLFEGNTVLTVVAYIPPA